MIITLLLRGAQTPSELRSRASRMYGSSDMVGVEPILEDLANWEDGPCAIRLAREPSRHESRYMYLSYGEADEAIVTADEPPITSGDLQARVEALETKVVELKQRLDSSLTHLGD